MLTIMYDWSVPIDAMSTSCSRLNMVDNNPKKSVNVMKYIVFSALNPYLRTLRKL